MTSNETRTNLDQIIIREQERALEIFKDLLLSSGLMADCSHDEVYKRGEKINTSYKKALDRVNKH